MTDKLTPRDEVISVLSGSPVDRCLCFSGVINVTQPGLDSLGLSLAGVHSDAAKLAAAAASSHKMFGLGSAVVPLDMCVEAEVLGVSVDFEDGADGPRLPLTAEPLAASTTDLTLPVPRDFISQGRVPVACEAIGMLGREFGEELAIGAVVPGPFTLATLLVDVGALLMETRTAPESVGDLLDTLTDLLTQVAQAYHAAGADFLTVHEMGGSPGFIGPAAFGELVLPRLRRLLTALPGPRVLHVCGRTNMAMDLLAAAGADALSVDQLNDLDASRADLGPSQVLLGNIDPVAVLSNGTAQDVRDAVAAAVKSGVNAIWPGCDLMPQVPAENMIAMVDEAHRHRHEPPEPNGG